MISLILADDHTMVRQAIATTLKATGLFTIEYECGDGAELVETALKAPADIILMDISMPKMNGFAALEKLLHYRPQSKIIILSMHSEPEYVEAVKLAGARAYIQKDAPSEQLIQVIQEVAAGKSYFPNTSDQLSERLPSSTNPMEGLTRREREIFYLVVAGRSSKQISQLLSLSAKTIENHRSNIFKKLNVASTIELIHFAAKNGLLEP
ncbi:response regulator transcription factor [Pseudidiomarina marina]|uniref:DNA-binding response regulator n=1 Tax=Pseudidiomarina marina TaxID=502366 RepID=A0A432YGQ6_9GAMM|nr:response regulator transcription factor [Pseudidiomarina marina]PHR65650.1 MAG: DNA-binding response regulator [Idiomarina sp.]RUO60147.1 DNA-binding response regulator [Pseudidiomarina marina]